MKRMIVAVALTCVLTGTVLAGDIPGVDFHAPSPGETQTPPAVTASGDMPTCGVTVLLTILDFAF